MSSYRDIEFVKTGRRDSTAGIAGSSHVSLRKSNRSDDLVKLMQLLLRPQAHRRPVLVNGLGNIGASAELILELAWEVSKRREGTALIIDANLRTPVLSRAYRMSRGAGLSEFLLGTHTLQEVIKKTNLSCVQLIRSGDCGVAPIALLTSRRLHQLLAKASELYELVLVNTPPYHAYVDTFALAKAAQPADMLIRYHEAAKQELARLYTELKPLKIRLIEVSDCSM